MTNHTGGEKVRCREGPIRLTVTGPGASLLWEKASRGCGATPQSKLLATAEEEEDDEEEEAGVVEGTAAVLGVLREGAKLGARLDSGTEAEG